MRIAIIFLCFLGLVPVRLIANSDSVSERVRLNSIAERIERILSAGPEVELISLDTSFYESEEEKQRDVRPKLRSWPIIETTRLKDPTKVRQLGAAIAEAVREAEVGSYPGCFNPRHALRWTEGEEVKILIVCFHCGNGALEDGKFKDGFLMAQSSAALALYERTFEELGMTKSKELERDREEALRKKNEERKKDQSKKAEPDLRANGPERPRLTLNVRQNS